VARRYPIDVSLASSLRERRIQAGLSQNAVALNSGLTEAMVARYETMRCGIPASAVAAIDRALAEAEHRQEVGTTL